MSISFHPIVKAITWSKRRFKRLSLIAACLLLVLSLVQLLVFPLPEFLTRRLVLSASDWILTDYVNTPPGTTGSLRKSGQKFLANLLEYSLIRQYQRRQTIPAGLGDAERVFARIAPLRGYLANQYEVDHASSSWPTFISGIGYCDQLNRVAAILLASEFPSSQLFCVKDPQDASVGHVIGRVWSQEFSDWLYYDLWPEKVIVFRSDKDSGIRVLAQSSPSADHSQRLTLEQVVYELYSRVGEGWVMNEYKSTFGGYLWYRLRSDKPHPTSKLASRLPPETQLAETQPVTETPRPPQRLNPVKSSPPQATEAYLKARLEQILGDASAARQEYSRVNGGGLNCPAETGILEKASCVFSRKMLQAAQGADYARARIRCTGKGELTPGGHGVQALAW